MKITTSCLNTKITGNIPQSTFADPDSNNPTIRPDSFRGRPIPIAIKLPDIHMLPRAKMTDFLSCSGIMQYKQLTMTDKLLKLFKKYEGMSFDYTNISVIDRKRNHHNNYYLLNYLETLDYSVIDLERSTVKLLDWKNQKYIPIKVQTYDDLLIADNILFSLSLNHEKIKGFHHFVVPIINRLIVSDELAQEMKYEDITGLSIFDFSPESDITQKGIFKLPQYL